MSVSAFLTRRVLAPAAVAAFSAGMASAQEFERGYADLVEKLAPSVVNISTTQRIERSERMNELLEQAPDLFERFPFLGPRGPFRQQPQERRSLGSGFVIDPDGLIVTNNHVIEDADEIVVSFTDGTQLDAELVGRDSAVDLAVLRVDPPSPLPALTFGDSEALRVGDRVIAIGNPFGLNGSVTEGIVSAKARDIQSGDYDEFIQTDAAINQGNSGGPLFNLDGEVVGVNTAIFSRNGGSIGISFSVPSRVAKNVVAQLIERGFVRRGWLGVEITPVDAAVAEVYELDEPIGALVQNVVPDSPAAAAGLEKGDVILQFNGENIEDARDLSRTVAETEVGETVRVDVARLNEGRKRLRVTLAERERDEEEVEVADAMTDEDRESGRMMEGVGLRLGPTDTDLAKRAGYQGDEEGVLIVAVDPEADAAGKVRPGELIVEIQGEPVRSVDEAAEIIARVRKDRADKPVLLQVRRPDGASRLVAVRPLDVKSD